MKKCKKCGESKTLDCFYKDKYSKDGHRSYCKNCANKSHAEWEAQNVETARQHALTSYQKRKDKVSQRRKELRLQNPEKYREQAKTTRRKNLLHYRKKGREASWLRAGIVGMTYEIYEQMLEEQNHKCAVCLTDQSLLKKNLGVDHNHSTGEPRGLLCDACNRAIGYLKESKHLFNAAVQYLEKYEE